MASTNIVLTAVTYFLFGYTNAQWTSDPRLLRLSSLEIAEPRRDNINYRLPGNVVPLHYDLLLQPNFNTNTFTGSVKIQIRAIQDTHKILLHQKSLNINANAIKVISTDQFPEDMLVTKAGIIGTELQQFYEITCTKQLKETCEYTLIIPEFIGTFNETDLSGFYLAKYEDEQRRTRKLATTQFEPTSARKAFPCFDEPSLKATFNITVIRPSNYNSVSNTEKLKEELLENGLGCDTFKETPPMSTYLIAIIVSQFQLSERYYRQRVLAKPQDVRDRKTNYALKTGEDVLRAMEDFVGVKFSLKKIDQAAIPDAYFSAGAMENWGLVTYKASLLLLDNDESQDVDREGVAKIIAHEYGHQWFGDLVSPTWWRYLWLNEGFATYFSFYAASVVEPTMRLMDQFVVKNTQGVFQTDAKNTTREMNMDVGSPNEIEKLFDAISYDKAGSVVHMMEGFLTTPLFREGLNNYLKKRSFKDASPKDLYESIQAVVSSKNPSLLPPHLTVEDIMSTWDSEKGFPLVYIERQYDETDNNIIVKKIRYMLQNDTSIERPNWIVPLNFATQQNPNFNTTTADFWLTRKQSTLTLSGIKDNEWIIANKKETGYYRVQYDSRNSKLITAALTKNLHKIDVLNRAQIIDDFFNLARSGHVEYDIPHGLLPYLRKEKDYIPLYAFIRAVTYLDTMLAYSPRYLNFQGQITKTLTPVYNYLTLDEKINDEYTDKLNRAQILTWMCDHRYIDCLTKTLKKFRSWKSGNPDAVALNLQFEIYCGAMRTGNQNDWDFLYEQYKEEQDESKRSRMLNALGCTLSESILEKYVTKTLKKESKPAPKDILLSVVGGSSKGTLFVLDFIKKNFNILLSIVEEYELKTVLGFIASKLTTHSQLIEVESLSRNYKLGKLLKEAVILTKANVAWNEANLKRIEVFYNEN